MGKTEGVARERTVRIRMAFACYMTDSMDVLSIYFTLLLIVCLNFLECCRKNNIETESIEKRNGIETEKNVSHDLVSFQAQAL